MEISTFKKQANTLIYQLQALINQMPDKGNTSAESQKITLLNNLNSFEASITGTEQEDLVNVYTYQVSEDPDPDAGEFDEVIRVFDENENVVFFEHMHMMYQVLTDDNSAVDTSLLKTYLVFNEGIMKTNDILKAE